VKQVFLFILGLGVFIWGIFIFVHPSKTVNACGEYGPFNFETFEAEDNVAVYSLAIELAVEGRLITEQKQTAGADLSKVRYPGLLSGSRFNRSTTPNLNSYIPPTILKSILWVESGWQNASRGIPWGGVGPTLRSFDCGYGVGQATTGMEHIADNPSAEQAKIGTSFYHSISAVTRILALKWNDRYRPIAGTGNPEKLEDWYYAIWSYNGFSPINHPLFNFSVVDSNGVQHGNEWNWRNHPLYPARHPFRGEVWHCNEKTASTYVDNGDGTPFFDYLDYTYPERIYGCMRYPPKITSRVSKLRQQKGTAALLNWADPIAAAMVTNVTNPSLIPVLESPRMWNPVAFRMPDLTNQQVAAAFAPENFVDCEAIAFSYGCPLMDFPTSFPALGIQVFEDPTPRVDPNIDTMLLFALLGAPPLPLYPNMVVDAFSISNLVALPDGTSDVASVAVKSGVFGLLPYRIVTSDPWVFVTKQESDTRIHAGVVIGSGFDVNLASDVSQRGYSSWMQVRFDPALAPIGNSVSTVRFESLLDDSVNIIKLYLSNFEDMNVDQEQAVAEPEPLVDAVAPSARFAGFVKIDGVQALTGALVIAFVDGVTCGVSVIDLDGTYVIDVVSGNRCGNEGDVVRFTVNGLGVSEAGRWNNTILNELNLNASAENIIDIGMPEETEAKPEEPIVVESEPVVEMYVVSAGDTCGEIAYDNGLELSELLQLNGITESDCWRLEIGQVLRIAEAKPEEPIVVESEPVVEMYVVSAGDTCSEIAYDNGLELSELLQLNGITESDCWRLEIGQVLKITKPVSR